MKPVVIVVAFMACFVVGFWVGSFLAGMRMRAAVLSGPYSDNYGPALSALGEVEAKLRVGDTNVVEQLQAVEAQIGAARKWAERFLGQPDDE